MSIWPVVAAMGLDPLVARGAVRLSVGRYTTEAEVDRTAGLLVDCEVDGHLPDAIGLPGTFRDLSSL